MWAHLLGRPSNPPRHNHQTHAVQKSVPNSAAHAKNEENHHKEFASLSFLQNVEEEVMGQANVKGTGRALAQERLRAEIAVKMHMAVGDRVNHKQALEDAFRAADADGDGTVNFAEFCSAAAAIGLGVSETELRAAFNRFDVNRDQTVEFQEVIAFMAPPVRSHHQAQQEVAVQHLERMAVAREDLDVEREGSVDRAVFRVAQTVFDRELNIRKAFQTWDGSGTGSLDISEFTSALNSLGFSLDLLDAKAIFDCFDIDKDGRIKCWEFVRTLGQFEAELNGAGDDTPLPGHNTGRGGGGDPDGGTQRPAASARIGGANGNMIEDNAGRGGAARRNESKLAQKSRLQMESEQQRRAEAEAQAKREMEIAAALAEVEARRAALAEEQARMDAQLSEQRQRDVMMAQQQYQQYRAQLMQQQQREQQARSQYDADLQAENERLRALMAQQQEAMERARAGAEQRRAEEAAEAARAAAAAAKPPVDVSDQGGDVSSVLETGLTIFSKPTSNTEVYQKGVYAWQPSSLEDRLGDDAIINALKARLKYVHSSAAEALSQAVKEPNVAKKPHNFADHGVDAKCLVAFAGQVLYRLSEARAGELLTNASTHKPKVAVLSVPRFLELFSGGGGFFGFGGDGASSKPPIQTRKVDSLTKREQKLLLTMRDYLFEQHSKMISMFRRCDPDGNGYVTIEEFLNAMRRAGVAVGHGLDRKSDDTITEEEAAEIVGFFDKDGDGHLTYAEFMTMLQATKTSVLTTKVLTHR